ncbi:hypothetical protein GCM10009827_018160 [Dactylosporangium maewongense]|uniref:Uncharacterized protein n=1 Tax=Dactylosporangium maewongense TaxID=634393 RepID=A0ABP4KK13_9ACTN
MLHGLLVVGAIGLIAVAPCLVCLLLISADEMLERGVRAVKRGGRGIGRGIRKVLVRKAGRPGWQDGRVRRWWHLSWAGRVLHTVAAESPPAPAGPPIEQLAGDLRRLNRLRMGVATRSPVWFNAVQRAYDEALRVACGQLGVDQYLGEVSGVDLEVERLRVEGELQRAGLALRDTKTGQR